MKSLLFAGVIFASLFLGAAEPNRIPPRWSLADGGTRIVWNVRDEKRLPHADSFEMSGLRVSLILSYSVAADRSLALGRRAAAERLAVAVAREWLLRAKLALLAEGALISKLALFAKRLLVSERRTLALRADLAYGDAGVLLRPIGGEVERPERTKVELR